MPNRYAAMHYESVQHQVCNARFLARIKGYHAAAAYLRSLNWSLEAALWILLQK